jgi:hypothetical protein
MLLLFRIRNLNWISTEQLDINLNERDKEVRELIWSAINGEQGLTIPFRKSKFDQRVMSRYLNGNVICTTIIVVWNV